MDSIHRLSFPVSNIIVIESDDSHVMFSNANMLVLIWYGQQQPDVCGRIYGKAATLARNTGAGKVAAVSIVHPGVSAPSPAAREALVSLHEDPELVMHRSALVFTNSGFVASAIRSIVLSLRQRASNRNSHDVLQNLTEALKWVTRGLPAPKGSPVSIDRVLAEVDRQDSGRKVKVA